MNSGQQLPLLSQQQENHRSDTMKKTLLQHVRSTVSVAKLKIAKVGGIGKSYLNTQRREPVQLCHSVMPGWYSGTPYGCKLTNDHRYFSYFIESTGGRCFIDRYHVFNSDLLTISTSLGFLPNKILVVANNTEEAKNYIGKILMFSEECESDIQLIETLDDKIDMNKKWIIVSNLVILQDRGFFISLKKYKANLLILNEITAALEYKRKSRKHLQILANTAQYLFVIIIDPVKKDFYSVYSLISLLDQKMGFSLLSLAEASEQDNFDDSIFTDFLNRFKCSDHTDYYHRMK